MFLVLFAVSLQAARDFVVFIFVIVDTRSSEVSRFVNVGNVGATC